MLRYIVLHIVLILAIFIGCFEASYAQMALQISPFRFEMTANPGDTKLDRIELRNNSDEPITIDVTIEDFHAGDEFGRPGFTSPSSETFSLAHWITPETRTIQIPPQTTREIPFAVRVPADAEPGGHYATMFFSPPAQDQGQVAVQGRIGALLLLEVSGEVRKESRLDHFGIFHPEVDFITNTNTSPQWLLEDLPVSFALRVHNTGNIHVRPMGTIAIYDFWGNQLRHIGIERIINQEGVITSQKQSDTLSINPDYGVVLPGSYRTFRGITWDGALYERSNPDTGKIELIKEKPAFVFGKYRAELTLTLGDETLRRTLDFWIIPWKFLIIASIITIITVILLVWIVRKYHTYMKQRIHTQLTSLQE